MKYLVLTGRIFFSLIFIMTLTAHFKSESIAYAASHGVPAPSVLVPLSAIIAAAGGLSIAFGYKAKAGAWLIVLFLIPVTFFMHAFWKETEDMQIQMQTSNFMKNISLLGAAFLIAYFGPGPLSIDYKKMLPDLKSEHDLNHVLTQVKGVRVEDTKDKIKADFHQYAAEGLHLEHFWQTEDPNEIVFSFRADNLNKAKQFIRKNHLHARQKDTEAGLPKVKFLEESFG